MLVHINNIFPSTENAKKSFDSMLLWADDSFLDFGPQNLGEHD